LVAFVKAGVRRTTLSNDLNRRHTGPEPTQVSQQLVPGAALSLHAAVLVMQLEHAGAPAGLTGQFTAYSCRMEVALASNSWGAVAAIQPLKN